MSTADCYDRQVIEDLLTEEPKSRAAAAFRAHAATCDHCRAILEGAASRQLIREIAGSAHLEYEDLAACLETPIEDSLPSVRLHLDACFKCRERLQAMREDRAAAAAGSARKYRFTPAHPSRIGRLISAMKLPGPGRVPVAAYAALAAVALVVLLRLPIQPAPRQAEMSAPAASDQELNQSDQKMGVHTASLPAARPQFSRLQSHKASPMPSLPSVGSLKSMVSNGRVGERTPSAGASQAPAAPAPAVPMSAAKPMAKGSVSNAPLVQYREVRSRHRAPVSVGFEPQNTLSRLPGSPAVMASGARTMAGTNTAFAARTTAPRQVPVTGVRGGAVEHPTPVLEDRAIALMPTPDGTLTVVARVSDLPPPILDVVRQVLCRPTLSAPARVEAGRAALNVTFAERSKEIAGIMARYRDAHLLQGALMEARGEREGALREYEALSREAPGSSIARQLVARVGAEQENR